MKTLVIHPADYSTNFLKKIYQHQDWEVVNQYQISTSQLKELIKSHDRIIMLGHGTEVGLIAFGRYIIDSKLVYLLREKINVCIWCHADQFVREYDLPSPLFTGMMVSEMDEAIYEGITCTQEQINESNELFSQIISKHLNNIAIIKSLYTSEDNPVIQFNQQRLYSNI